MVSELPSMSGSRLRLTPGPLLTPGRGGPGTLATVSTPTDPAAVVGRYPAPAPRTLTTAEVITAATAVLDAHAAGTPQEQADAVRSWWLGNFGSDGRPPCAFAVLSLVLPDAAFAIAFQAHFDAATAQQQRSAPKP